MRYLTFAEVTRLHQIVLEQSGGADGVRDPGALKSAIAQPAMRFGGMELYPTLAEKAATLCFSLVMNHAFVDGNKRVGHAAMEVFLAIHGKEIAATVDEQEQVILRLAAGQLEREEFTAWLIAHIIPLLAV